MRLCRGLRALLDVKHTLAIFPPDAPILPEAHEFVHVMLNVGTIVG